MTIKEFKHMTADCDDNDLITFCVHKDDNPVSDYEEVDFIYKIQINDDDVMQICLMPK